MTKKIMPADKIDEKIVSEWAAEANDVRNVPDIWNLTKKLTEQYKHDDRSIVHATFWAMVGTFKLFSHASKGMDNVDWQQDHLGFIMWSIIGYFNPRGGKSPMGLIHFTDLIYPEYKKIMFPIPTTTWVEIKQRARITLNELEKEEFHKPGDAKQKAEWEEYREKDKTHLQSILDDKVPPPFFVTDTPEKTRSEK